MPQQHHGPVIGGSIALRREDSKSALSIEQTSNARWRSGAEQVPNCIIAPEAIAKCRPRAKWGSEFLLGGAAATQAKDRSPPEPNDDCCLMPHLCATDR